MNSTDETEPKSVQASQLEDKARQDLNDGFIEEKTLNNRFSEDSMSKEPAKWINNNGEEVENVFGFNSNSELVNGRAAMIGFLMLIITELILNGDPVTHSIFGIG